MFDEKSIEIFSSRDQIRDQLIEHAKDYLELEGLDMSKLSYLPYIINMLSGLTANLIYYNTSVFQEFFLTKAKQKESILNLAAMLGYTPPYATPARSRLLIELPISFDNSVSIEIPKGFKYYASGKIVFTQDSDVNINVTIDNNGSLISVMVVEIPSTGGVRSVESTTRTENGTTSLYFMIDVTQLENETHEFTIPEMGPYQFHTLNVNFDGQISTMQMTTLQETGGIGGDIQQSWELYNSLFLIPFDVYGYTFRRIENGGEIYFGNGVVGKQAPSNNLCTVVLGITHGAKGNVISGSITRSDRLYVQDGININTGNPRMKPVKMVVVNPTPAYGGVDSPSIDEIRTTAIAGISTLNRLVSDYDYDNIKSIITDLPIQHAISILKRSDIRHEISLFSNLIFEDLLVPTRNEVWTVDESVDPEMTILTTDILTINGTEYYSMFNIFIDVLNDTCYYFYLADEVEKAVILNRTYRSYDETNVVTDVIPTQSKFITITTDSITGDKLPSNQQLLRVELRYNEIVPGDYTDLQCFMITDWDGTTHHMTRETVNPGTPEEYDRFMVEINLENVSEGDRLYYFKMYVLDEDPANPGTYIPNFLNESQINVIIKEKLDEFMYSIIEITGTQPNRIATVYDVPVIKKSYYDAVNKNAFTLEIYDKITSLDINQYKMISDFVNLKFSNTTGALENMKYNLTSKNDVININPSSIPGSPNNGDRYIITNDLNPWGRTPPFIAEYNSISTSWTYDRIITNDIIYVSNFSEKFIFNGEEMIRPISTIPFVIHLIVWKDTFASTSSGMIENIKNALIDGLYSKFGFDKNVYISEITKIVQSVPGVNHCKVVKPTHDVFFNYDITKDLTQAELLTYSPELVWFDSSSIYVEVR